MRVARAEFVGQPGMKPATNVFTGFTVTATVLLPYQTRCIVVTQGDVPTAAEVYAGTHGSGSPPGLGNNPGPALWAGNAAQETQFTGLSPRMPYDVYCATAGGMLSALLDVTTQGNLLDC